VADVVVATGEMIVRKQQIVLGGYDETQYVTGRLWVEASDGVAFRSRSSPAPTCSRSR
jgi:oligopeptidase B